MFKTLDFRISSAVLECIHTLENAGFEAWLVGGCVRDMLRGVRPADFDQCSSAPPETVMGLFRRAFPTGLRHGTITVVLGKTRQSKIPRSTSGKA
ncbi:MAG: hypothetical protein LBQ48_02665 [Oscillospiraceae bacterium]|nr:hypothetical protein [Oscillospiraceae bacterium]